jgi:phospholipase/carboxylesterase
LGDRVVGASSMCSGATALHVPDSNPSYATAFMVDHEYVHVHADGSIHVAANPFTVDDIVANGWAEKHPDAGRSLPANVLLVYSPRDQSELEAVLDIVRTAYAWAADI